MRVRLGVVSYLNSRPLVEVLRTGAIDRDFELIYGVPSRCAERLHMGETDVALIPAAEIGRGRDPYRIVPNIGIISNGPVGSVFIVLNKKPEEIQTLALDRGSRTSVVLAQIVLARQFGCQPEVFFHPPDIDAMLKRADAALVDRRSRTGIAPQTLSNPGPGRNLDADDRVAFCLCLLDRTPRCIDAISH